MGQPSASPHRKLSLLLALCVSLPSFARVYIDISGASVRKAKIAVGELHALKGSRTASAAELKELESEIREDLKFTDLFELMDKSTYSHLDTPEYLYKIRYQEWGLTGASFVIKFGYRIVGTKLSLEVFLYDIPGRNKVFSTRYEYAVNKYYQLVHAMSDDVLKEITGETGLFKSRILMVCRDTNRRNANKEIYLVNPDGRELTQITRDNTLTVGPAWGPGGKSVSYTQYKLRRVKNKLGRIERRTIPVLMHHFLKTGRRVVLSERNGMNSGAAWAPNGNQLALTLSYTGRPEIYLLNASGKGEPDPLSRAMKLRRISGIGFQPTYVSTLFDVEPSWAPKGDQLVFSSARTGHPMIYVMDIASKEARQLTFAGQYNSSPSWSPKGDKILFAAQHHANGNFDVYVIDPDGNNLARLTAGGKVGMRKINYENPVWASTGRHFAYAGNEDNKVYQIYVRTLDGSVVKKISPPNKECTMPAWGPPED
ncbi:MAG: PD40 domain-containing protein [Bdellovibrionaceae bacterium]|nr:PD40 domain-containing protein [Bdellovibrionales bacterium]MCB9253147.1 PD40 domain-containing protein [Pseudobdellovibrionaceae bacterium]